MIEGTKPIANYLNVTSVCIVHRIATIQLYVLGSNSVVHRFQFKDRVGLNKLQLYNFGGYLI